MPNIRLNRLDSFGLGYVIVGLHTTIYAGFQENYYLTNVRNIPFEQQTYPFGLVGLIGGFMLIHILMLLFLARQFARHPYLSIITALGVTFGFVCLVIVGSMHSPSAWAVFAIWEVVVLVAVVITSMIELFKKLTT